MAGLDVCWLTFPAKAMHLLTSRPLWDLVVIMPNLHELMKATKSSTFSLRDGFSRFLALYGSAGLEPVSALLKPDDILMVDVVVKDLLSRGNVLLDLVLSVVWGGRSV